MKRYGLGNSTTAALYINDGPPTGIREELVNLECMSVTTRIVVKADYLTIISCRRPTHEIGVLRIMEVLSLRGSISLLAGRRVCIAVKLAGRNDTQRGRRDHISEKNQRTRSQNWDENCQKQCID